MSVDEARRLYADNLAFLGKRGWTQRDAVLYQWEPPDGRDWFTLGEALEIAFLEAGVPVGETEAA